MKKIWAKKIILSLVYLACFVLIVLTSQLIPPVEYAKAADTYTWDGGGNGITWANNNNWEPDGSYPADNTDIAIINTGAATIYTPALGVTIAELQLGASFLGTLSMLGSVTLDSGGGGSGDLTIASSATLTTNSTTLNVSGDWTNSGVFNAGWGTVNFTATSGTFSINSTGATNPTFSQISFSPGVASTAIWNLASDLDVGNSVVIDNGTLSMNVNYNIVTTSLSILGGNYTKGIGTFTFNGGEGGWQDDSGTVDMGTVVINTAFDTLALVSAVTSTTLEVSADETFACSGFTVSILGSGTGASRPFKNSGSLNACAVSYKGTSNTEIEATTYGGTLTLAPSGAGSPTFTLGTAGGQTVSCSALVFGDGTNAVVATADTYDPDITVLSLSTGVTINANATFQASDTGSFTVRNNWTNSGTFTPNGGTVTFTRASGTQSINSGGVGAGKAFFNISHTGGGTARLLTNNIDIDGSFSNSGGTFDTNGLDMSVADDWTNSATFTAGTRTVTFDGGDGVTQIVNSGGTIAGKLFYHFVHSGTSILQLSGNDLNIDGNFTHSAGIFDVNARLITCAGNWSISSTFTKGSTITFDGTTAATYQDFNVSAQNIGPVTLGKTSGVPANDKLTITDSTLSADSLTISAGNTLSLDAASSSTQLIIAGGGTITNNGTLQIANDTNTASISGSGSNANFLGSDIDYNGNVVILSSITYGSNANPADAGDGISLSDGNNIFTSNVTVGDGVDATSFTQGDQNVKFRSDLTINAASTYTSGSGTITFDKGGGGSQTLTDNTNSDLGNIAISANAGNTTLNLASNVILESITIDSSQTLDATNGGGNYNISMDGDWTNSGNFTPGTGNVTFNSGAGQTLDSGGTGVGKAFNDIIHSGAGTLQLSGNDLDINGNLTNSAGTLDANGRNIYIAGNWANTALFTAGGNTVYFDGADGSTQEISGETSFYNFVASTQANSTSRTLQFEGGKVQTITSPTSWTITGYPTKIITLQSSNATSWVINPSAASVTYANVSRSANIGASFCATYSTDGGNNLNWQISTTNTCVSSSNGSYHPGTLPKTGMDASGDDFLNYSLDIYKIIITI